MDESLPVTLIVKAPNQQVADQTIHCHPHWTIRKLKGHLSEVYPCNPKSEEQKLIYSGQLLSDTVVLKDVLRTYEGQDTHTVHLVCTSPQAKYGTPSTSKPTPSPTRENTERSSEGNQSASTLNNPSNTEGLRHRNVGEMPSYDNQEYVRQEYANDPNMLNTNPYNPQTPYYFWNQEQADAWTEHINQLTTENNAYPPGGLNYTMPNITNMNPMMFAAQVAWMQRMQQFQQYYAGNLPGYQPYSTNQQIMGFNPEQVYGNVPDNQEIQQQVQQEPANQNNNRIERMGEIEERDWLDWLYNLSRIMFMAAVAYFYSSPIRFMIVLILGLSIYIFQTGFFNLRLNQNDRQDIDNINNNYQQPADNNNERAPNNAGTDLEVSNQENNIANNQAVNEDSFFSVTWTAFTSFFTSLIPETPNAIRN